MTQAKATKIIEIESKIVTTRIFRVEFTGNICLRFTRGLMPIEALADPAIPGMYETHPEYTKLHVVKREVMPKSRSSFIVYVRYSNKENQ